MSEKYADYIKGINNFSGEEFKLHKEELHFHEIDLMQLVKTYGSPLKFSYLPKISRNILNAKKWFKTAMDNTNYKGTYKYCYCTKSSHFKYVLDEVLKNEVHIETSSAIDLDIVALLKQKQQISNSTFVICNGFKNDNYIKNISRLINSNHSNCIPILDNFEELNQLNETINVPFKIGLRIATEEGDDFKFETSRLGIPNNKILHFYINKVSHHKNIALKMLHFYMNTGINNSTTYFNELLKCVDTYIALKKECTTLDSLNLGGGFPIKNDLEFNFDYKDIVHKIIENIKQKCDEANVSTPHIFTEFGSFTVGESGGVIYKVLHQKKQNENEKWNIIDSSFFTTLPDSWIIKKKFLVLPLNNWQEPKESVMLGGLTCDSDDYYSRIQHKKTIYLPKYNLQKPLYIGFFNTGAYQESIGGFGGIQHCLIPSPKHILINKDEEGNLVTECISNEQKSSEMLNILGYN